MAESDIKEEQNVSTSRCCRFLRQITAEPVLLFQGMCLGIQNIYLVNLWVDKVCDQFHYSQEVCQNLDSGMYKEQQDNVQREVNRMSSMYAEWLEYIPAMFAVMVLGAWGDARDRKLPLLLCTSGLFVKVVWILVNCVWWWLPYPLILVGSIPAGLTGSLMAQSQGCNAYISATTTEQSRTSKISVAYAFLGVGMGLGNALGTFVFDEFGYVAVFAMDAVLLLLNICYIVLRLEKWPLAPRPELTTQQTELSVCEALSPATLASTAAVAFKKREGNTRSRVLAHVFIIWLVVFSFGSISFTYLYSRKKFGWDNNMYSLWGIVAIPLQALGTGVLVPLLGYWAKLQDDLVALVGAIAYMFFFVLIATAPVGWVLFLALGGIFGIGMCFAGSRGALSKLVAGEELGAVFALVGLGEAIVPLVNYPLYTVVYNATLDTFPGTIFTIAALTVVLMCTLYTWMLTLPRPAPPVAQLGED